MILGGIGGSNTLTGLMFEGKVDLSTYLSAQSGYAVKNREVFFKGKKIAEIYKKHDFYKYFLKPHGVDYRNVISKKLLPDNSIFVIVNNTLYIIECKFQRTSGSVDEKLQTCDFKRKQYKKLVATLNIDVEYVYLLSKWFEQPQYKDVLDYIHSVYCQYYFEYIPLHKLGLPIPE